MANLKYPIDQQKLINSLNPHDRFSDIKNLRYTSMKQYLKLLKSNQGCSKSV